MKNNYLEFYGKYDISPVKQDISDFDLHLNRRKKLYRQLGVPLLAFQDANILEVGSGGGYNTIAFFEWGAHVDIVEANKKGIEDMNHLFHNRGIDKNKYQIFNTMIENYSSEKKYNIIIAEGFLPCVENKREIIEKLKSLLDRNGIIVVTCMDEMGMFVEQMKRLVAHIIIKDIPDYREKVAKLVNVFEPQLKTLQGVSRSAEDWVQDQLMCTAINIKEMFSLVDAIGMFNQTYDIMGSSPHMFTDYSWYKNVDYNVRENYIKQFGQKNHNLLIAGTDETIISNKVNKNLEEMICNIRNNAIAFENKYDWKYVEAVIVELAKMLVLLEKYNSDLLTFVTQLITILKMLEKEDFDLSEFNMFFRLFGRSQQYISFVKN